MHIYQGNVSSYSGHVRVCLQDVTSGKGLLSRNHYMRVLISYVN